MCGESPVLAPPVWLIAINSIPSFLNNGGEVSPPVFK